MGVRLRLAGLCLAAALLACAQGRPEITRGRTARTIASSQFNIGDQAESDPLMSEPLAGMEAPLPMSEPREEFSGEACRVGAQFVCPCPDGGSGVKTCLEDPNSPTGGAYGECQNCGSGSASGSAPASEPSSSSGSSNQGDVGVAGDLPPCENGVRDGEESDVDCGGLCDPCEMGRTCVRGIDCESLNCEAGSCAEPKEPTPVMSSNPPPDRSSGSSPGGEAGPDPGEEGGSGGRGSGGGSSGGGGGSSSCGTCTNDCFPIGILPCCNLLGVCGCTWAPGAYCL